MNDLISRQAAIDALLEEVRLVDGYYAEKDEVINKDDAIEAIRLLPSAQPEEAIPISSLEEIIEKCRMVGDRTFSSAAVIMHVMLNEWRREQHE